MYQFLLEDWRQLDELTRDTMWEEIQARFNLKEQWQKDAIIKQMGGLFRASKSRLVANIRAISSREKIINLKPSNIPSLATWLNWVKSKKGEDFKKTSAHFRELRRSQIPHTTGRRGMVRLTHKMKKQSKEPEKVTRSKVWIEAHTHKDGRPARPEFEETIEKIKTIDSELDSTASTNIKEDAVSKVLGQDRPGELEEQLHNLTESRRVEVGSTSERKRLFGEGEFVSSDAAYKIGRIPIGPNTAAIIVKSYEEQEAGPLWRPSVTVRTLRQAVGQVIAWPVDRFILDSEMDSPTHKTAGSAVTSDDKINIYDWNSTGVIVAEGRLCSTDPDDLVNDIPLGPGAAIVKVDVAVVEDAYQWRPVSDEMFLMSHAVKMKISWPQNKIQQISQQAMKETISKNSSPKSVSHSSDSSKSGKRSASS
ncbi:uncharacterized protein LOC106442918 [Brassica napus]|uniref:uncharacterized protein LOC106442918 n=1 Tax=Brassica napus TaxID=3708 RepID=UPI00207865DE|nr:uncharacterized protein LOC106442918 [Brassica napus]